MINKEVSAEPNNDEQRSVEVQLRELADRAEDDRIKRLSQETTNFSFHKTYFKEAEHIL